MRARRFARLGRLCLVVSLPAVAAPLEAQDRFGAAVTLTDAGEVAVLKPGKAVGPAVTLLFQPGPGGAWTSTAHPLQSTTWSSISESSRRPSQASSGT